MKKLIGIWIMLFILCGCTADITEPSTPVPENTMPETEATTILLPVGTAKQKDCQLCRDNGLWNYYKKFDSIGVINLCDGQISDLSIFEYEDDGTLMDNSGFSTMRHNNDDDGHRVFIRTMGSRGVCNLSLSWDEGKDLDLDAIADEYCRDCMKKITAMDAEWSDELAEKGRCPFAMIDFTDGQLYSLNGILTNSFIRDYYMSFQFEEQEIDGVVVYAPERTFE